MGENDETTVLGRPYPGCKRFLSRLNALGRVVPQPLKSVVTRELQRLEMKLDIRDSETAEIEFIFDGGAFLNWRSRSTVSALVLTPKIPNPVDQFDTPVVGLGPTHGVVDLRGLEQDAYELSAKVGWRRVPVTSFKSDTVEFTRNEGATNGSCWTIQNDESGIVSLVRISTLTIDSCVVAIDAALGVLTLAVAPLGGKGWRVQLIRRRSEKKIMSGKALSEEGQRQEFRLSTPEWVDADLSFGGKKTVWDVYLTNVDRPEASIRLQWGGSSTNAPRETVRFRPSYSWAITGEAIQMRPYWTLDQHLAVELLKLENEEGTHA